MQALKVLVTILTLLIIVAITVIAYGMYRKSVDPDFRFFELSNNKPALSDTQMPPLSATSEDINNKIFTPNSFGEVILSLPSGCNIATVNVNGYRLFLKIGPSGHKCERIIIINSTNGAILGTIKTSP